MLKSQFTPVEINLVFQLINIYIQTTRHESVGSMGGFVFHFYSCHLILLKCLNN